jgi:aminoglycoside 6'-N-acetyltransferase/ribosomal-protein-alanine N-acetyltransferase
VRAGLDFARQRYGPRGLVLDVAAFNERARRVYERAGFVEIGRHLVRDDRHGTVEFVDMARPLATAAGVLRPCPCDADRQAPPNPT